MLLAAAVASPVWRPAPARQRTMPAKKQRETSAGQSVSRSAESESRIKKETPGRIHRNRRHRMKKASRWGKRAGAERGKMELRNKR